MKDTHLPFEDRLLKVKIIYRGWRNYHKYCDLSQVNMWTISDWVYRFGKKRTSMDKDILLQEVKDIFNGHPYKVNGHISVQSHRSPYDGDWVYWSKRQDIRYKTLKFKVAKRQNFQCGRCKLFFQSNEQIELHHMDGNNKNNRYQNLLALHRFCHQCESNHGIKKQRVVSN